MNWRNLRFSHAELIHTHPGPQVFLILSPINAFDDRRWQATLNVIQLHLNEAEASGSAETRNSQCCGSLRERFKNAVIIKYEGAACCSASGDFCQIQGQGTVVVDTIGAGDCHAGTILAGLKQGWPLEAAAALANVMAAKVVSSPSARLDEAEFQDVLTTWKQKNGKDLPSA
ncbi:MAG: PfkB family carbohydrate kinase [Holdemania massiliensis]